MTAAAAWGDRRASDVRTVPEGRLIVCVKCVERTIRHIQYAGPRAGRGRGEGRTLTRARYCRCVTAAAARARGSLERAYCVRAVLEGRLMGCAGCMERRTAWKGGEEGRIRAWVCVEADPA